jgi:hypothetical protein
MTREPDIDDAGQSHRAAPGEFELTQGCFEKDDHGLPSVGRGRHRCGVVHDHAAATQMDLHIFRLHEASPSGGAVSGRLGCLWMAPTHEDVEGVDSWAGTGLLVV